MPLLFKIYCNIRLSKEKQKRRKGKKRVPTREFPSDTPRNQGGDSQSQFVVVTW
jgi:hypothetical protein